MPRSLAAVKRFFKKYATFTGRASRSEDRWWALVSVIISFILNIIVSVGTASSSSSLSSTPQLGPGATFGMILLVIWGLATIVPSIALTVRRLHDSNKRGWMALRGLIPFAGPMILLVFAVLALTRPAAVRPAHCVLTPGRIAWKTPLSCGGGAFYMAAHSQIQVGGRGLWRIGVSDIEDYIAEAYSPTAERIAKGDFRDEREPGDLGR